MDYFEKYRAQEAKWASEVRDYILRGGDPNIRPANSGWGFVHIAAEYCNPELIALLAAFGADLNVIDLNGWTPLIHAVDSELDGASQDGKPFTLETAKMLIMFGADQNLRSNDGKSARDFAARYGKEVLALYDSIQTSDR